MTEMISLNFGFGDLCEVYLVYLVISIYIIRLIFKFL